MNIFKKKSIPTGAEQDATVYEKWIVRYTSRHDPYSGGTRPQAEFFTNESDARLFYNDLKSAFKLVKNTCDNDISINKE